MVPENGHNPPHGRSLEIPRGRGEGGSTTKIQGKGNPGERKGSNEKTFHGGGMDIFWNHTILYSLLKSFKIVNMENFNRL